MRRAALTLLLVTLAGAAAVPAADSPPSRLIFLSGRDGTTRVYSALANGARLTRLAAPSVGGSWEAGSVSADGRWVAFESSGFRLFVVGADGTRLRRVGTGLAPVISPDGRRVAYVVAGRNGFTLAVVGADGRGRRLIGPTRRQGFTPSWSPDGREIAHEALDTVPGTRTLVVQTLRDDDSREVARGVGHDVEWSPSGGWIAFLRSFGDRDGLWVVRPDGTGERLIARDAETSAWSPDGTRLAFADADGRIGIARVDGTAVQRRDVNGLRVGSIAWSPDGTALAFEGDRWPGCRLWLADSGLRTIRRFEAVDGCGLLGWTRVAPRVRPAPPVPPSERVVGPRSLALRGPIADLSADGNRVAVLVGGHRLEPCMHVVLWAPATRALRRFQAEDRCGEGRGDDYDLELAGTRFAWTDSGCGNFCEYGLATATVTDPVAEVLTWDVLESDEGFDAWRYNVHGDGDVLVFNPAPWDESGARLVRIGAGSDWCSHEESDSRICTVVRTGSQSAPVASVHSGRIALNGADGVALVDLRGALLRTFPFPRGARAVRLDHDRLVVAQAGRLEGYDLGGSRTAALGLAPGDRLIDAESGLAVVLRGRAIRVLRLSDGRVATFHSPGRGAVRAELEPSGLFYAFTRTTRTEPGRVEFVPMAAVTARLARR